MKNFLEQRPSFRLVASATQFLLRNRRLLCTLAIAAALALTAATAPGGVDEARKLLAEKRYDQVDKALGGDLRGPSPSAEALGISLEAAVADGRLVTAQRRVTALLKATSARDLDLVYRGARIAEQAREDSLALTRYVDYAQRSAARSEKLRHALTVLAVRGKFPQLYRKYLRLYGKDEVAWKLGIGLLARLVRDGEVNGIFDTAQMLLESFPQGRRVTDVHRRLLYAAENGKLGRDDQNVYVLPMRIAIGTVPSDYGPLTYLVRRAAGKISKEDLLTGILAHQQLAGKRISDEMFWHLREIGSLSSQDKKITFGRKILAIETLCRKAGDAAFWTMYLRLLSEQRGAFRIEGRVLLTEDLAARLIAAAAPVAATSPGLKTVLGQFADSFLPTPARRAAVTRKHAAAFSVARIDRILPSLPSKAGPERDKIIAETNRAITDFLAGRGSAETAAVQYRLVAWYDRTGNKKALIAAARSTMDLNPSGFHVDAIGRTVLDSKLLTDDEKVALVRDQLLRAGADAKGKSMDQLIGRYVKKQAKKTPKFQALVTLYEQGKGGTDVLCRYTNLVETKKGKRGGAKGTGALAEQFASAYSRPIPLGPASCKTRDDVLAMRIMEACYSWTKQSEDKKQVARIWLSRAPSPGLRLVELAKYVSSEALAEAMGRLGGSIKADDPLWGQLADIGFRPANDASPLTAHYARMGPRNALHHVLRQMDYPNYNRSRWNESTPALGRELDKVVAMRGFKVVDASMAGHAIVSVSGYRNKGIPVADRTVQALWRGYTAAGGDPDNDLRVRQSMLRIAMASKQDGRIAQALHDLHGAIGRLPLVLQAGRLEYVCRSLRVDSEHGRDKAGPYAQTLAKLADVYARMADADWTVHRVEGNFLRDFARLAEMHGRGIKKDYSADGQLAKTADRIVPLLISHLAGGARAEFHQHHGGLVKHVGSELDEAIEAERWADSVGLAGLWFRLMPHYRGDWASVYHEDIIDLVRTLEQAKAWEALHVTLLHLQRAEPPEALATAVAKYRTTAANNIVGLVAVSRRDKTYPLHQAAQLLSLGNEGRAWQLTRTRLAMLGESWSAFEPKYVAWCIDQMRKNKMLTEARDLALTVLLRENDLDPAVAARILLAKGDIYRDMRNNEIASIEYRALRNSSRYQKTKAGIEATYHLVNLMIDTGQYSSAEQLIERLIDSVDLPVKAEGYYLAARLAYQQKKYAKASENIDKVRMCVNDHVEAAFLDGLLKLKLPGGMITPEVEIGTAATRRILIPGEELALKLQDANLSIARDDKAIPIIVRSTSGKDEERVDLLSLAGRKNLFSGTLRTSLGQPKPNNGVLEVSGADRVSYIIAPEFQKKNHIDYPAKFLDIRTVGQLAASAGEILTPEEIEKRRVQQGLADAADPKTQAAWKREAGSRVRPGNDIYLQVYDVDQDITGGRDTVAVKVTTTNGDVIEALKLTETAEHSALFRVALKTAVPLPKAIASDTFEGKSAASAINSTRPGAWSSLADGAKGKWLGVDMMSSHEFKTITAAVPNASTIKSVRLMARLAQDYREIASFPVMGVQRGLRAECFADKGLTKRLSDKTVTSIHATPGKGIAAVRYSGVFVAKVGGTHTFTAKTTGQVSLSVGDKEILSGKAAGGEKTYTGQADIAIDAAAVAARGEAPFVLVYIPSGTNDSLSLTWSAGGKSGAISPVAMYPGGQAHRRDEVAVRYARVDDPRKEAPDAAAISKFFAELGRRGTVYTASPSYAAAAADWGILQMTGSFYVPKARYMTLKLQGKCFANDGSWGRLFVDGKEVLVRAPRSRRRAAVAEVEPAARVKLTKGVHTLRIVVCGQKACDASVVYQNEAKQFAAMPAEWFSVDHHPEIAPSVSPEGHIAVKGNTLVCELTAPTRLRAVKWVFDDYEGNAVVVNEIGVVDGAGKTLIPVKRDFTSATTNDILEIAPGDEVQVLYVDVKRPSGGSPDRRARLATGYYNGTIQIANEVITDTGGGMETSYFAARRCGIGDALAILVDEADNDASPKRDVMDVLVETSGGQKLTLKALEMPSEVHKDAEGKDVEAHHTGKFLALLRLGKEPGKGVLPVQAGDKITVSYMDRENSDPGVAVYRRYELFEGGDPLVEQIDFERYTSELVRTEFQTPGERLMRSRTETKTPKYTYVRMLRSTFAPREAAKPDDPLVTSIRGPLAFSIMYPAMAKHTASTIEATVWAESDVEAAKTAKPKREPRILTVKMGCGSAGLDEGVFRAEIRLQVGLPGQNADLKIDEALAILDTGGAKARKETESDDGPTLVVVPGDIVHVAYKDPATDKQITDRIRVLAQGGLEILDAKLQVEVETVRLGEKFHLRVDDTDRDTTPERDAVTVKMTSQSGDTATLALTETLGRSGVFTGWVEPKFLGDRVEGKLPKADLTDDVLSVFFGDEIAFEYIDPAGVDSAAAVTYGRTGRIHKGSDADTDLFSKQFRDSEMAVKTSFLMAEALFELAKQKRKLKKPAEADTLIARGKRLLEITIRDYPDTKLKVQSRFLLANLAQELGKQNEAIAKYSQVIAMAPQSEQASKSQFKMAQCYEELDKFDQACEEYVKVTYVYESSPLAPKARLRMGQYYMKRGQKLMKDELTIADGMKNLRVAARIFAQFRKRHASHELAAEALFLSGQCDMEMKNYRSAAETLAAVIEDFPNNKKVRAEAMYWCAESLYNIRDYKGAYRMWTELIWAYPEVRRAKEARGRLASDEKMVKIAEEM